MTNPRELGSGGEMVSVADSSFFDPFAHVIYVERSPSYVSRHVLFSRSGIFYPHLSFRSLALICYPIFPLSRVLFQCAKRRSCPSSSLGFQVLLSRSLFNLIGRGGTYRILPALCRPGPFLVGTLDGNSQYTNPYSWTVAVVVFRMMVAVQGGN